VRSGNVVRCMTSINTKSGFPPQRLGEGYVCLFGLFFGEDDFLG
jgi:hypothetical protein